MAEEIKENQEKDLFTQGTELYQQKAPLKDVIDIFLKAAEIRIKDPSLHTCLSWLYLLRAESGDIDNAIDSAKMALRSDPGNAQAHFNLLLGLLMAGRKGIREQFEKVMGKSSKQDLELAIANLKDALERKPEFMEAAKLLNWIESRI